MVILNLGSKGFHTILYMVSRLFVSDFQVRTPLPKLQFGVDKICHDFWLSRATFCQPCADAPYVIKENGKKKTSCVFK